MSSQLVWALINKHNSFKRKGRTGNRVILSAEPGNLYNKHSYKHSGMDYFDRAATPVKSESSDRLP